LIAAQGDGASALIELFSKAHPGFAASATLLYVANSSASPALLDGLDRLGANALKLLPDVPSLLRECSRLLDEATMGTTIYVCGAEGFIGEVAQLAGTFGIGFHLLRTDHPGSPRKRVQCVHCKFIDEQLHADTVICPRCKVRLFVRDHYSHRLNAYMGVSVDAEVPLAKQEPIP
jgi:dimethylamine monooxygenase subunit C